jgi:hypothetical protein
MAVTVALRKECNLTRTLLPPVLHHGQQRCPQRG